MDPNAKQDPTVADAGTEATVEQKNQAGTAPRTPTDPSVAKAHAKHEERRQLAEDVQAEMEKAQADGADPQQAKAYAQYRNRDRSPEDRNRGRSPEDRSDNSQTDKA